MNLRQLFDRLRQPRTIDAVREMRTRPLPLGDGAYLFIEAERLKDKRWVLRETTNSRVYNVHLEKALQVFEGVLNHHGAFGKLAYSIESTLMILRDMEESLLPRDVAASPPQDIPHHYTQAYGLLSPIRRAAVEALYDQRKRSGGPSAPRRQN